MSRKFTYEFLHSNVTAFRFVKGGPRSLSWRDRFDVIFGCLDGSPTPKGNGWQHVHPILDRLRLHFNTLNKKDQRLLVTNLFEEFRKIEFLPAFGRNSKLWQTRRGINEANDAGKFKTVILLANNPEHEDLTVRSDVQSPRSEYSSISLSSSSYNNTSVQSCHSPIISSSSSHSSTSSDAVSGSNILSVKSCSSRSKIIDDSKSISLSSSSSSSHFSLSSDAVSLSHSPSNNRHSLSAPPSLESRYRFLKSIIDGSSALSFCRWRDNLCWFDAPFTLFRMALLQFPEDELNKISGLPLHLDILLDINEDASNLREDFLKLDDYWVALASGQAFDFTFTFWRPFKEIYGNLFFDENCCANCCKPDLSLNTDGGVLLYPTQDAISRDHDGKPTYTLGCQNLDFSCSCLVPAPPPFVRFANVLGSDKISFDESIMVGGRKYIFCGALCYQPGHFTTIFRMGVKFYFYNDKSSEKDKHKVKGKRFPEPKHIDFPYTDPQTAEIWYVRENLWKTFYKSCCILQRSDYLENNANSINNLRSLKLLDNVTGDGNCGFRVISLHIYGNENQWSEVRRKMIDAIPLMGWKEQESTEMAKLLSHFEGSAPTHNLVQKRPFTIL
jgi:hypothetical protein